MRHLIAACLALSLCAPPAIAQSFQTSAGTVTVERVAGPFEFPWSVAFLPDGTKLVTERPGRLSLVGADGTLTTVSGVPEVREAGQGGLLDVAVPPDFATSREVYLSYSEPDGFLSSRTALARGTMSVSGGAAQLSDVAVIFRMSESSQAGRHFGSRIVFADDGTLWLTIGDRGDRPEAQNLNVHNGKVLRLNRDGSVPADNPFVGRPDARPEIWSYGHRNPQGAVKRPSDGALVTVSHGARGGDEVNVARASANYGWPEISYGRHYSGLPIGSGTSAPGMEQPLWYWDPSIAPSGASFYSGALFPSWRNSLFVGALRGSMIARLEPGGSGYQEAERLFPNSFGRIRDVREGPDGALWFLTDDADGALYRVTPG